MELSFHNKIRQKLGNINVNEFETLVNDLMRIEFIMLGTLEVNQTKNLKSRKGKPDAHLKIDDGSYIVFNYTITQERNVKAKIIRDIEDLRTEKSLIGNKISKVITCTNTPIDENRILYETKAEELGWKFDVYSLDGLTNLLIKHSNILKKHFNLDIESDITTKYYNCGNRVKILREERNLKKSQFIELISINSENKLEAIESNQLECSSIVVKEICDLMGVEISWLKHGIKKKYKNFRFNELETRKIGEISYFPNIKKAYFCLETENMNLIIIIKYSKYNYAFIDYHTNLKFWDWFDEHGKIENIFKELKYYHNTLSQNSESRIITKDQLKNIYSYEYFPKEITEDVQNEGKHWLEELLWYEDNKDRNSYYDKFSWFVNLKKYLKEYFIDNKNGKS
jgi:hypothetical protein